MKRLETTKIKYFFCTAARTVIVPLSYSDRAAQVYEDVEYHVIEGAGHGFSGSAFDEAVGYVFDYLQQIEII